MCSRAFSLNIFSNILYAHAIVRDQLMFKVDWKGGGGERSGKSGGPGGEGVSV